MKTKKIDRAKMAGIVLLMVALVLMMWLAMGCADDEERNNPLDPNAVNYVTPTVTPAP